MRVMVAMSGGVDSSVAAARLADDGHDVVGVTLKLWGGESDQGCCSVSDVDDARRVAQQLGIDHHVFNFGDVFSDHVVGPYVADHAAGRTPNPCIECNRHVKFDALVRRAEALGFDAVATGHHARVVEGVHGPRLARGTDRAKDQSYVLYVVPGRDLARVLLPVGEMTKAEVRAEAAARGLRSATKADSQDVCFITARDGRRSFLGDRIPLHPGRVVDEQGTEVGTVPAVELVTVGQRKGLGLELGRPRYVTSVDRADRVVHVGPPEALLDDEVTVEHVVWADQPTGGRLLVQCSAHGEARPAQVHLLGSGRFRVGWESPQRRVAPGQSVVLYDGDVVVGGGIVPDPSELRQDPTLLVTS
jgi:tRNA-specific 2-thiouridylase